jgi:hypothetical protein
MCKMQKIRICATCDILLQPKAIVVLRWEVPLYKATNLNSPVSSKTIQAL